MNSLRVLSTSSNTPTQLFTEIVGWQHANRADSREVPESMAKSLWFAWTIGRTDGASDEEQ